jgi:hypothetical protein
MRGFPVAALAFVSLLLPGNAPAQTGGWVTEDAYLQISAAQCTSRTTGTPIEHNGIAYCKAALKMAGDACERLTGLNNGRQENNDVPTRLKNIDGKVNLGFSSVRRDAKSLAYGARLSLLNEMFARANPTQWDLETGFVPDGSVRSGPMVLAYRHYLTWLEYSCLALRTKQMPDLPA